MKIKGENVRNVISGLETNLIRALIRGACFVWQWTPDGAREPTFVVPIVPPQSLATQSDREGAEARGTVHYASDRRPPTPNRDLHRRHVVLLVGSRYIYIILRL
jgi:hypothetical protein